MCVHSVFELAFLLQFYPKSFDNFIFSWPTWKFSASWIPLDNYIGPPVVYKPLRLVGPSQNSAFAITFFTLLPPPNYLLSDLFTHRYSQHRSLHSHFVSLSVSVFSFFVVAHVSLANNIAGETMLYWKRLAFWIKVRYYIILKYIVPFSVLNILDKIECRAMIKIAL